MVVEGRREQSSVERRDGVITGVGGSMKAKPSGPGHHGEGYEQRWLANRPAGPVLTAALGIYLFALVTAASWTLIAMFPRTVVIAPSEAKTLETSDYSYLKAASAPIVRLVFSPVSIGRMTVIPPLHPDQGLLVLALLAGILGSFLHAAQSLAAYVGNRELRPSWVVWYTLRPLMGGVLGLLFYFVVRAGLVSASADSVSPYGVVAFGALAGWFSKQATEKLAEVFETLFRTERDESYKDKLIRHFRRPRIAKAEPPRLDLADAGEGEVVFMLSGEGFAPGSHASANGVALNGRVLADDKFEIRVPSELAEESAELSIVISHPTPLGAPPGTPAERSEPFAIPVVGNPEKKKTPERQTPV